MPLAEKWMDLKIMIISETQTEKYHISLIYGISKNGSNAFTYKTEIDPLT